MQRLTATAVLAAALCLGLACAACESCTPKSQKVQTAQGEATPATAPDARLYFISDLAGQIEPCGCVKDQPGGLDHLAAAVRKDWEGAGGHAVMAVGTTRGKAPFDMLSAAEKPQRLREAETIGGALRALGTSVELPGQADHSALRGGHPAHGPEDKTLPSGDFAPHAQLVAVGQVKIAVLVTDARPLDSKQRAAELEVERQRFAKDGAKHTVLLTTLGRGEAKRIAEFMPELDAVVVGRDLMPNDDNTDGFAPEQVGKTWILEPANHGQQVAVLDLWVQSAGVQARTLDVRESAGSDAAVLDLMRRMDQSSNEANAKQFASLLPAKASPSQAAYVGVKVCGTCHADALKVWEGTEHSHAYATLETRHKNFNLDCVGCHVTGYDKPGGSNVTHVEGLKNVQCENCHGPGSKHAAAPTTVAVPNAHPGEDVCVGCHHTPHVKSFDFGAMLPRVLGPGHGVGE